MKQSGYKKDYQTPVYDYCGRPDKTLVPYDINAARSRLPVASVVMPHKGASYIELGEPTVVHTIPKRWRYDRK